MQRGNASKERVATTRPERRRGMTRSQIRAERRSKSDRRRRRKRAVWLALGGVFAVFIIFALVFQQGLVNQNAQVGGSRGVYNSGGPVPEDPDDGRNHVRDGEVPETRYSIYPPTSGPHWNSIGSADSNFEAAPAGWGPYDRALPDQVLIHNLEHGGIGMHYDPTKCGEEQCDAIVEEFKTIAKSWTDNETYTGFVISPYPDMESAITLTAWRHHLRLDEVDEPRIREFINAYYDRGYEPQVAGMTPG